MDLHVGSLGANARSLRHGKGCPLKPDLTSEIFPENFTLSGIEATDLLTLPPGFGGNRDVQVAKKIVHKMGEDQGKQLDIPTIIVDQGTGEVPAPPPADEPNSMASSLTGGSTTIVQALHSEEAARARTLGLFYFLIGGFTALGVPLLNGAPILKVPTTIVLAGFALFSLFVSFRSRSPERYTKTLFRLYGAVAVTASSIIVLYLGPFSPTALAVTLGIGFFGQGADRSGALAICISAITIYLAIFALIMSGMLQDMGVFRGDEAGLSGRLFMVTMVPLVLSMTLLQARWSRNAVSSALDKAISSTMEASRRRVQLEEAQAELDRIAATGGMLGRLSGQTVGWYRLGPLLGKGGSGEVYEALDTRTSKQRAIKVLNHADADDEQMANRFRREGEIAKRLISPYVAQVLQYGRAPGGTMFIAMERLQGSDLAAILRKESRLSLSATKELIQHLCRGITDAHAMGIIHRDVKPHNIFRARGPKGTESWKVLDFGVSKLTSSSATITQGGVVGTPQYMSPEQARGEHVDHTTDIYGIGAVLYRILTGRPPVAGKGHVALFGAAHKRPAQPRKLAPDLSRDLEAVLALSLAANPRDRFQEADQLRHAFEQALAGSLSRSILKRARLVKWSPDA